MPARNGAEANHSKPRAEMKKWPAYFHDLGYEVAAFGKVSHYKHTAITASTTSRTTASTTMRASRRRWSSWLDATAPAGRKPLCLFVGSNWPHVPWPEDAGATTRPRSTLPPGSWTRRRRASARARYAAAVAKADDDLALILRRGPQAPRRATRSSSSRSDHGAQWPFGKWNCYDAGIRVPLIVAWPGRGEARDDAPTRW